MHYGAYQTVRNDVWSCLLEFEINRLPTDVHAIARGLRATVAINGDSGMVHENEYGACLFTGKRWYIVYDETQPPERIRLTLAHEIGHILLGHAWDDAHRTEQERQFYHRPNERAADAFALRLLCPLCVLNGMQVESAQELARACEIPLDSAKKRFSRLQKMRERGRFFEKSEEVAVYRSFLPYIERYCLQNGKNLTYPVRFLESGLARQYEKERQTRP